VIKKSGGREKTPFAGGSAIAKAIQQAEGSLNGNGAVSSCVTQAPKALAPGEVRRSVRETRSSARIQRRGRMSHAHERWNPSDRVLEAMIALVALCGAAALRRGGLEEFLCTYRIREAARRGQPVPPSLQVAPNSSYADLHQQRHRKCGWHFPSAHALDLHRFELRLGNFEKRSSS